MYVSHVNLSFCKLTSQSIWILFLLLALWIQIKEENVCACGECVCACTCASVCACVCVHACVCVYECVCVCVWCVLQSVFGNHLVQFVLS